MEGVEGEIWLRRKSEEGGGGPEGKAGNLRVLDLGAGVVRCEAKGRATAVEGGEAVRARAAVAAAAEAGA